MDTPAPELSRLWLVEQEGKHPETLRGGTDEDAGGLTAAMEALANLVSAARSIV